MAKATKKQPLGKGLASLLKDDQNEYDQTEYESNPTIFELKHQLKIKDIEINGLKDMVKQLKEFNESIRSMGRYKETTIDSLMEMNKTHIEITRTHSNKDFIEATIKAKNTDWSKKDKKKPF